MNDNLNNIFDVEVTEVTQKLPVPLKPKNNDNNISIPEKNLLTDLQSSREDYDTIIELGKSALIKVLDIAEQGQHPRFFEAAGMILKSLSDANKERMEIHLKLSQIRKNQAEIGGQDNSQINVEKAVFIGTTEQLSELLNPRKNKNENDNKRKLSE